MPQTPDRCCVLPPWQFWLLTLLAAAALLLLVLNMLAATEARTMQQRLGERLEAVQQGARWIRLKDRLVQRLTALASERGDRGIATLLATQGIALEGFTAIPPGRADPGTGPVSAGDGEGHGVPPPAEPEGAIGP